MNINENDFISFLKIRKKLADSSIGVSISRTRLLKRWLIEYNKELNKESIEQFLLHLKDKGRKNSALNTYINAINHLHDYFADRDLEYKDRFKKLSNFPKTRVPIDVLTTEEIKKITSVDLKYGTWQGKDTNALNATYKTFIMFLALTGCRFSEAGNLKMKYLNLSKGEATFIETKNKECRKVAITEPLISKLKEVTEKKEGEDYVFTNMRCNKIIRVDFIVDLKKRARQAGIKKRVYPHLFRHSFITELISQGIPIVIVASIVGHKDINTTNHYTHLADDSKRQALLFHPLIKEQTEPREILKNIKNTIESFGLGKDKRFVFEITERNNSLSINIGIKDQKT